jgi:hypothetical protein
MKKMNRLLINIFLSMIPHVEIVLISYFSIEKETMIHMKRKSKKDMAYAL